MTKRTKRNIAAAVLDIILGAAWGAVLIYAGLLKKEVSMQTAAELWESGGSIPYSVASLYYSEDSAKDIDGIYSLKASISKKMKEESINAENEEGGRNYIDCWYGESRITVSSEKTTETAEVFYVGGDYFRIHIPQIVSGGLIYPEDISTDRIVLDENASWLLFGSRDTEGMTVEAGGKEYVVAGVIAAPNKKGAMKRAYDEMKSACVYLPYQAADTNGEAASFTGYDILMPDKVLGYAKNIISSAAGINEKTFNMYLTESRSRFRLDAIKKKTKEMNSFVSRRNTAVIPYWEAAAREAELDMTICFLGGIILAVPTVISLGYWLVELYRLIVTVKNAAAAAAERASEARNTKAYLKKQQEKQQERQREKQTPNN